MTPESQANASLHVVTGVNNRSGLTPLLERQCTQRRVDEHLQAVIRVRHCCSKVDGGDAMHRSSDVTQSRNEQRLGMEEALRNSRTNPSERGAALGLVPSCEATRHRIVLKESDV